MAQNTKKDDCTIVIDKIYSYLEKGRIALNLKGLNINDLKTEEGPLECLMNYSDGIISGEHLCSIIEEYLSKRFLEAINDLNGYVESLVERFKEHEKIDTVLQVLEIFVNDWKEYLVWFNLIETKSRDVIFCPASQRDADVGKIISLFKEDQSYYDKYITSLASFLKKRHYPDRTIIMTNDIDKIREGELANLATSCIVIEIGLKNSAINKYLKRLLSTKSQGSSNGKVKVDWKKFDTYKYKVKKTIEKSLERQGIKNVEVETITKLINYFLWVKLAYNNYSPGFKYIILIPATVFGSIPYSINIGLRKWPGYEFIFKMRALVSSIFSPILEHRIIGESLRSAIAAIMSRNMSHNIGSHVLARLTNAELASCIRGQNPEQIAKIICVNDKCTEEEKELSNNCINSIIGLSEWSNNMQIFLRYLQQRQDFIATISTEWPEWTDSAYFLRDVMQWFLQQKHLLDNIAASEDLVGHSYDHPSGKNDIRFHIFLCPSKYWNGKPKGCNSVEERYKQIKNKNNKGKNNDFIILYTNQGEGELSLEKDILISIPGGIVGYHAFYIMIENIIRNAAKHSYKKSGADHLDVVIEILSDPEGKIGIEKNGRKQEAFLFRIYDNVSRITNKKEILLWGSNKKRGMNDRLGDSLIDESAKLKKESWGLAEIKISAAYLRGLEINRLGANASSICGDPACSLSQQAQSELGSSAIIRAVKSPLGTLGYEFFVLKPRLVGIHCKNGGR